ncbi:Histone chaperone asf1a-A [Galdieria sulphuraria]|uniref:Histone chaperone ASF1 n=1 Tax=Galdieria sulphuraria TaxID=130081 RepID=M2W1D3_GALSU|nr:histone chaperone ASF1 [Galdieria sulphuraria]EME29461.1 histone chaperone ASF1 [Galdieria sulphuraria]GJD06025.1 Histone chaperone asf1a-A [Galdieria sulphuraria]|eukprot:XP_005705981.1 histone chaperone ASF1 [Galdieria sulphuraria]
MSAVEVLQVDVLNNPGFFGDPFRFEITYEVREALQQDIEWKVIYVSCAKDESLDQVLDEVLLPADTVGRFQFTLEVAAPNPNKIPDDDLLGITAVLITCSYRDQEFIRIGYYLNNEYEDAEMNENPPCPPLLERIRRHIFAEEPRVTHFLHSFDSNDSYLDENSSHSMVHSYSNLLDSVEETQHSKLKSSDMPSQRMNMF